MSKPAFSDELRTELANGKYTRWAVNLTESELTSLLWMVGEYGIRSPAEPGGVPSGALWRREAGSYGLAQFVMGNPMTFQEACAIVLKSTMSQDDLE